MRTIVDIPEDDLISITQLSKSRKVSRAELFRVAVRELLDKSLTRNDSQVFGLWKDRDDDGLAYQERMRAEWER